MKSKDLENNDDFHLESALMRVNGNKKLLKKLLIEFAVKSKTYCESLSRFIDQGQMDQAASLLHTIKGISGNLSLYRINSLTSDLERQLKDQKELDIDSVKIWQETMLGLIGLMDKINIEYAIHEEATTDLEELSELSLQALLNSLIDHIENLDFETESKMNQFFACLDKDKYADEIDEMKQFMRDYDYDKILPILNHITNELGLEWRRNDE